MVAIPATPSGDPARVLEIGAGPADTDLGLPPRPGSSTQPDPHLIDLRRTDVKPRPGVDYLNANEPLKPEHVGRYDTVIINNPRGYNQIDNVAQAIRPGGRIILQGRGETFLGERGINPDFQKLLERPAPPGFEIVDQAPDHLPSPQSVLGSGFNRTTGKPIGRPPNFRIVYQRTR
jgi:hypothetical protein